MKLTPSQKNITELSQSCADIPALLDHIKELRAENALLKYAKAEWLQVHTELTGVNVMAGKKKNKLATDPQPLDFLTEGRCRPAQVAGAMGICRATLYNRIKEGKLPPLRKDGKRISFWFVEEIRPYLRPPEVIDAQD